MSTFVMALSFTNGKYIEVGVNHLEVADMKKRAFNHLKTGDVMECENICFKCSDMAFIAFYEKKIDGSGSVTDKKIDANAEGQESQTPS